MCNDTQNKEKKLGKNFTNLGRILEGPAGGQWTSSRRKDEEKEESDD